MRKRLKIAMIVLPLTFAIGLIGCKKEVEETPAPKDDTEVVTMSAAPADDVAPAIVADDIDEAEAQAKAQAEMASKSEVADEPAEAIDTEAVVETELEEPAN